jgi:hypothetical protein
MSVHIHAPAPTMCRLRQVACPTCERPSYCVVLFYEWYAPDVTCLRCGERWSDGEVMPRPFRPGWRAESVERARRSYRKWRHLAGVVRVGGGQP